MSTLEVIETEVRKLPRDEALQLQDWLAELNPDVVASIERGKADLREGRVRVRQG